MVVQKVQRVNFFFRNKTFICENTSDLTEEITCVFIYFPSKNMDIYVKLGERKKLGGVYIVKRIATSY
jgi:hypothetical protein